MQHRYRPRPWEPAPGELPPLRPDDAREPGRLLIDMLGVRIDWTLVPRRGNVRQWRAYDLDGAFMAGGGKDAIVRAALKRIPAVLGLRR